MGKTLVHSICLLLAYLFDLHGKKKVKSVGLKFCHRIQTSYKLMVVLGVKLYLYVESKILKLKQYIHKISKYLLLGTCIEQDVLISLYK